MVAALSSSSLAMIAAGRHLGIGLTPFRSLEILAVPLFALAWLFPISVLLILLPYRVFSRLKEFASGGPVRAILRLLALSLLFALVWAVFGTILRAEWWIIDDHEIMTFLGSADRLRLSDIASRLSMTEVGSFGTSLRFRPTYYVLRLLETAAWGRNPGLWYAFRLILVATAGTLFWILATPVVGEFGAVALWAYVLTFQYWVDIFGRLGPSETYTVVGLPLFLLGFVRAAQQVPRSVSSRIIAGGSVLVGAVLCIGSKENYLILLVPLAYLCYRGIRDRDWIVAGTALGGALFGAWVGASLATSLARAGVDFYGASISSADRLGNILRALENSEYRTPFSVLTGLTILVGSLLLIPGLSREKRTSVTKALGWFVLLCGVFLSQWYFYNGNWPSRQEHYNFPGLVYLPASIVVLAWLGGRLMQGSAFESRLRPALRLSLIAGLVLAIIYHGGLDETQEALVGSVDRTIEFTNRLEGIVSLLRGNEELQLVVEATDVWNDYEPSFGYPAFLRSFGVGNRLFLRLHGIRVDAVAPGLLQQIAARLVRSSLEGDGYYTPLRELKERPDSCYSLFLSAEHPTACTAVE